MLLLVINKDARRSKPVFGFFTCAHRLMFFAVFLRSQRLNFDVSSPNGILLFREASKMICTYGEHPFPYLSLQYNFISLEERKLLVILLF